MNIDNKSRLEKVIKNIFLGFGSQFILLLLSFINRTIFIKYLGIEYLGINSLFANILFVLNLADLGMSSAMAYSLYKPLYEKDNKKIISLITFFKKIYRYISLGVFLLGISLIPFLDKIVNLESSVEHIYIYYLLYVINSALSYLFVYKTTVIFADQKNYILKKYNILTGIMNFFFQILSVIFFQSFMLYLLSMIATTFYNNYLGAKKSDSLYLSNKNSTINITKEEKKEIFNNVKSMFFYRIAGVILNNTISIFISIFVGTIWVGYYSNYLMLITGITSFTTILISSFQASIGNLIVSTSIDKQYMTFKVINFIGFTIFGIISLILYAFIDSFIELWIGKEYILPYNIVLMIIVYFFVSNTLFAVWLFRDATNIFKRTKNIIIMTTILNIILILILQNYFGLAGIFISPILARLLTNFWYEPYLLVSSYFKSSPKGYFMKILLYIIVFIIFGAINKYIVSMIVINSYFKFILVLLIDGIIIINFYIILFYKSNEMYFLRNRLLVKIKQKI